MASNYTENLGLCQWEVTDQVLRTEFNEDNAKIDEVLGELRETVARHSGAIAGFGNCQLYYTTYTGDGNAKSRTYTFPAPPAIVFRKGPTFVSIAVRGNPDAFSYEGSTNWGGVLSWSGNSMTVNYIDTTFGGGDYKMGNESGVTYYMVALIDATA